MYIHNSTIVVASVERVRKTLLRFSPLSSAQPSLSLQFNGVIKIVMVTWLGVLKQIILCNLAVA